MLILFYIEEKVQDKGIDKFVVIDTSDYTMELYTEEELLKIAKTIDINGVDLKNGTVSIATINDLFGVSLARDILFGKIVDCEVVGNMVGKYKTAGGRHYKCEYRDFALTVGLPNGSSYKVPEGITTLAAVSASHEIENLDIILPNTVKEICDDCFYDSQIRSINLEYVRRIGDSAFALCKNLKEITLSNIEELYPMSFGGSGLRRVNLEGKAIKHTHTQWIEWLNEVGSPVDVYHGDDKWFTVNGDD